MRNSDWVKHPLGALIFGLLMLLKISAALAAGGALGPDGLTAVSGDYLSQPPLAVTGADPFLMIDLSVELTQQAEGYTDAVQTYPNGTSCPDRLTGQTTPWGAQDFGICYSANETFIGYFDPAKCYAYDTSTYSNSGTDQLATGPRSDAFPHFFKPVGLAPTTISGGITTSTHNCSANANGKFSGNFLNWSTMTALDEFRSAMTGGARLIDTSGSSASTMLIRTRRYDDWGFVIKAINAGGLTNNGTTFKVDPSTVTPFTSSDLTTMPASVSGTTACTTACSTSGIPCKKGNKSKTADGCSCTQGTTTTYTPSNTLLVVNNFGTTGSGTSYHRTRFYTFGSGTTTTTKNTTTVYTYSLDNSYVCPTVNSSSATPTTLPGTTTVAKLLTVGGDSDINVIVKVCDPSVGVESNCAPYTDGINTWYKPEGLLQKNSIKMTYALDSYTGRSGNAGINGGVLRANAKYVGAQMPTSSGGIIDNPNKEVDANGLFVFDPDKLAGKPGVNGVAPVNSGVINYINQFALFAGGYKANDPDAELYYEGLRYIMHLGPTPSFSHPSTPLTAQEQDGYPVFAGLSSNSDGAGSPAWSDPIRSSCQKNYALYIGDKNTWANNYIPGGYSLDPSPAPTPPNDPTCVTECADALAKGINASALEDYIGSQESGFDHTTNQGGRMDGYGTPALAWWANTHDVRTDITGTQRVKSYMVDTQEYGGAVSVGNTNELWLAAKWGGFEDSTNNNIVSDVTALASTPQPDLTSEWNAKGASLNGILLPDTYTLASQPANLVAGLGSAFGGIISTTGAAAAAAVVANTSVSAAAVYQSLFRQRIANSTAAITWAGTVRSFFVDDQLRFREDTDHNGKLSDTDDVIVFQTDSTTHVTVVDRYSATTNALITSGISINNLDPIWDASSRLSALTNTQVVSQRSYANTADTGRYILTWVDTNGDGVVDAGEVKDFTAANFPNIDATTNNSTFDPARLLGLDSTSGTSASGKTATNLVNYIRGLDQSIYRSRTIDPGDGSGSQTFRLGDVVHSAALTVTSPSEYYDSPSLYNDTSYAAFKSRYANRRGMLYVGANDGMLHAFNVGFFGAGSDGLPGYYTSSNLGAGSEIKHPLGTEMWAYVPYDLLPHLQFLAEKAYGHEYFVDGKPQSFDVNIFNDCGDVTTCDHPYGWGTILVVGMRLGGGDLTVNATTDQTSATDAGNRTLRSAYIVLDITNPEHAPTLLAELTQPTMGFTVSTPIIVKSRSPDGSLSFKGSSNGSSTTNQWYLVMGSGPAGTDATSKQLALTQATSNQQARVFAYDLNNKKWIDADTSTPAVDGFVISTAPIHSFVGDMSAADWFGDYTDEVIYFGTIGTAAAPNSDPIGDLMRMQMPSGYSFGTPTFSNLLTGNTDSPSNGQPFAARPFLDKDINGQPWVYAGSGRFYVSSDILSAKQMSYFGIREPLTSPGVLSYASVDKSSLPNVTGVQTYSDGTITSAGGGSVSLGGSSYTQYAPFTTAMSSQPGWYFNLVGLSERDVDISIPFNDNVVFTAYTASNDLCAPSGSSRLVSVGMANGIGTLSAPLGSDTSTHKVVSSVSLGSGQSFLSGAITFGSGGSGVSRISPNYYGQPDGGGGGGAGGTACILTENSSGSMTCTQGKPPKTAVGRRSSWRELPLQ